MAIFSTIDRLQIPPTLVFEKFYQLSISIRLFNNAALCKLIFFNNDSISFSHMQGVSPTQLLLDTRVLKNRQEKKATPNIIHQQVLSKCL